jgi:hypothetical protein
MRVTRKTIGIFAAIVAVALAVLGFEVAKLRAELAVATASGTPAETPAPDLTTHAPRPATYSNIYRYDYVGPETCAKCHTQKYETWRSHPHAKMNRNVNADTVVGDFSGRRLEYGGGAVVFAKGLGELTMTIYDGGKFVRQHRVTRVVGSRFVQMYVGVQTQGPEPPDDAVYTREVKLPFSYWIARDEWFPETYDEAPDAPEYDATGKLTAGYRFTEPMKREWQMSCIKCHNTYPYVRRFESSLDTKLVGFPETDVSLKNVATTLKPPSRRWELDSSELVTLGISCESCHFGGREHATKGAAISFLPRSQDLDFPKATPELAENARREPYVIDNICGQCHTAKTPGPTFPNGAASWNSREARDLQAGACASKIMCTSCHDPHVAGPTRADAPASQKELASCTGCHAKYAAPAAATAHTKHDASVTCLDCHMPRIVHGLGGMIRTHRISSPTDARMLRGEWPNACNACHLDRSARWTVAQLTDKWNAKIDLGGWQPPDEPMGKRWLGHREAVVRAAAVDFYSRTKLGKGALPDLLPILEDPSPPARMFGLLAIERIVGRRIDEHEYTPWAAPDVRKKQAHALAEK